MLSSWEKFSKQFNGLWSYIFSKEKVTLKVETRIIIITRKH